MFDVRGGNIRSGNAGGLSDRRTASSDINFYNYHMSADSKHCSKLLLGRLTQRDGGNGVCVVGGSKKGRTSHYFPLTGATIIIQ